MDMKDSPIRLQLMIFKDTLKLIDLASVDREMIGQEIEVLDGIAKLIHESVEVTTANTKKMSKENSEMVAKLKFYEQIIYQDGPTTACTVKNVSNPVIVPQPESMMKIFNEREELKRAVRKCYDIAQAIHYLVHGRQWKDLSMINDILARLNHILIDNVILNNLKV